VCCICANKDTAIYSSYVRRVVFSGVLQSENLTSNALTQNTRTRLAVIDNLCRGRRAVPLQTITTRHSNRKQTTDRQTDDGRNGDSIGLYSEREGCQSTRHTRVVNSSRAVEEEVIFALMKSKCMPVLLYGTEACPVNSAVRHSLQFALNRALFKIFGALSKDTYQDICKYFGIWTVPLWRRRFLLARVNLI